MLTDADAALFRILLCSAVDESVPDERQLARNLLERYLAQPDEYPDAKALLATAPGGSVLDFGVQDVVDVVTPFVLLGVRGVVDYLRTVPDTIAVKVGEGAAEATGNALVRALRRRRRNAAAVTVALASKLNDDQITELRAVVVDVLKSTSATEAEQRLAVDAVVGALHRLPVQ